MRTQVLDICGEPTDIAHRKIVRYKQEYKTLPPPKNERFGAVPALSHHPIGRSPSNSNQREVIDFNDPIAVEKGIEEGILEYEDAEDWFYDLGPSRMTRNLIFISNRLEKINVGDRGF